LHELINTELRLSSAYHPQTYQIGPHSWRIQCLATSSPNLSDANQRIAAAPVPEPSQQDTTGVEEEAAERPEVSNSEIPPGLGSRATDEMPADPGLVKVVAETLPGLEFPEILKGQYSKDVFFLSMSNFGRGHASRGCLLNRSNSHEIPVKSLQIHKSNCALENVFKKPNFNNFSHF
jgi:hypothetical protein